MYKVIFPYYLSAKTKVLIEARCEDVEYYEAQGLDIQFLDEQMNVLETVYDKEVFEDIEYEATQKLLEVKHTPELNFDDEEPNWCGDV